MNYNVIFQLQNMKCKEGKYVQNSVCIPYFKPTYSTKSFCSRLNYLRTRFPLPLLGHPFLAPFGSLIQNTNYMVALHTNLSSSWYGHLGVQRTQARLGVKHGNHFLVISRLYLHVGIATLGRSVRPFKNSTVQNPRAVIKKFLRLNTQDSIT